MEWLEHELAKIEARERFMCWRLSMPLVGQFYELGYKVYDELEGELKGE